MKEVLILAKGICYKDYPSTIKLFSKRKDGKYKMIPVKSWTDRDETTCQPIVSYRKNEKETLNIGMVLDRLLVIDVDVGHQDNVDGRKTLVRWLRTKGDDEKKQIEQDISETMRVNTPSGGTHIYFFLPLNMEEFEGQRTVGAMEGVDLLTGENSYIPAPKSKRGDGYYQLHHTSGDKIKEAPKWLIQLFEEGIYNEGKRVGRNYMSEERKYETLDTSMNKIFDAMFLGFEQGTRNDKMTSLIGSLLFYVRKQKITMINAVKIVEVTANNCNPPMKKKEWKHIWNGLVKKENRK